MGYSYGDPTGGGKRRYATKSNVWFYPKIRLVPSSEYSFWGINDTNCLVFDTYFGSNISWTRNGPAGNPDSTVKPPRKVFFKDEAAGTTKEAVSVGYATRDSNNILNYQSVWVKPQVVKCTTAKGYILTVSLHYLPYDEGDYYMGPSAIIPAEQEDLFFDDDKLSYPWHLEDFTSKYISTNTVDWNNSFFLGYRYDMKNITYCLYKEVSDIYKYRTFYFIVPTGCRMCVGLRGLDFWAYNGNGINYFYTWNDLKDNNWAYAYVQGYYDELNISGNSELGGYIGDYNTIIGYSDDSQPHIASNSKLYNSSSSKLNAWEGGLCNIKGLSGYSSGSYSDWLYALSQFTVRDGELTWYYNNHPTCSGMTINYGEPYNRYMYLPNPCIWGNYAYVYKDCESLYGCTLAYNTESTSGMKDTSLTWNVMSATASTDGSHSLTYSWTINNQHDSSGTYQTRFWIRSASIATGSTYDISSTDSSIIIGDFSSGSKSSTKGLNISPSYLIEVICTKISETDISNVVVGSYTFTNSKNCIAIDASYYSNCYSYSTIYYNNGDSSATITNTTSSSSPSWGTYPKWYVGKITKISTYTKSYSHSCRYASRVACYTRSNSGSWSYSYGSYKYPATSFSSYSSTASWYDNDYTYDLSLNTNNSAFQIWFTYSTTLLVAPIIQKCVDAGSWKRTITVYNPNPVSLTLGYTSNKTNSKTSANSGWETTTMSAYGTSSFTISDQSGYSDEWIICGFQMYNGGYYCNTIDEDVTSGTPNVVNSNWWYSR